MYIAHIFTQNPIFIFFVQRVVHIKEGFCSKCGRCITSATARGAGSSHQRTGRGEFYSFFHYRYGNLYAYIVCYVEILFPRLHTT